MSEYGFVELSKQLGASLLKGAEDNVAEATKLLDEVRTLVEEIQKHVEEQAKALDNASARTKAYGERVLAAHKEYLNGGSHENPSP
jgi:flagellin-like hook-associated protein FlgL